MLEPIWILYNGEDFRLFLFKYAYRYSNSKYNWSVHFIYKCGSKHTHTQLSYWVPR